MPELLHLLLAGVDQPQANQPNSLAEDLHILSDQIFYKMASQKGISAAKSEMSLNQPHHAATLQHMVAAPTCIHAAILHKALGNTISGMNFILCGLGVQLMDAFCTHAYILHGVLRC
eukprot:1161727-Pelagomonas_calceolata.AAC.2